MFKISIVETLGQRRVVLQGKLISPWAAEVEMPGEALENNLVAAS